MRLPRFRLRTLMIAVVVIGIPIGIVMDRQNRFWRLHQYHQARRLLLTRYKEGGHSGHDGDRGRWFHGHVGADMREFTEREYAVLHWHEDLAEKYRRAASRPWLPVPPDPPAPR